MIPSRLRKYEDQQDKKHILWALAGSVGLLIFLLLFGLKILVGFSLMVDKLRGTAPVNTQQQTLILPPTLDPLPMATNSANLVVTGKGDKGLIAIIYLNDERFDEVDVKDDGTFEATRLPFTSGENTVSAKQADKKGNTSDLSNVVTVIFENQAPKLTIDRPDDGATVNGEKNIVEIAGITDEDASVTINDRFVVVRNDGSFEYDYPLNEGENILTIVATDPAGNTTKLDRAVKYEK